MILTLLFACNVGPDIKVGDSDTSTADLDDADADGWSAPADCDDADAAVHPTAIEVCNGVDDDCDGQADENVSVVAYVDADGDGFGAGDPVTLCAMEAGYAENKVDCDDTDPAVRPGATEVCDGVDNDCDGETDPDNGLWYTDADGDGYGDEGTGHETCTHDTNEVQNGDDCDDADEEVSPAAADPCGDGVDTDCDGHDSSCMFGGEYDMGSADAKAWAPDASDMAAEYMDIGDINGDGYADVALTTMYANAYNGGAYVVYGPLSGSDSMDDVGDQIIGSRATYAAGRSIAVGDANDDGFDDIAIGAADETCREWIIFGPLSGDMDLEDADVARYGLHDTEVGHGSDLADVNADGVVDLIVGAYENDTGGRDAGIVYVEFGPFSAGEEDIAEVAGLTIIGDSAGDYAGRYVHAGEDVDGDGIGDILAGAPYASGGAPSGGGAYLIYGGLTGEVSVADADAKYVGEHSGEYAAEGLTMGDVSGDGLADVVLGSMSSVGGAGAGAVYIVYGPGTAVYALDSSDVVMHGDQTAAQLGLGLDVEDADGDGVGDLLVGAKGKEASDPGSGAGYLFFGPVVSGDDPSTADASFWGEGRNDAMGTSTALGDLNADGLLDAVFGAPLDATGGMSAGAIFVQHAATAAE